MVFSRSGFSIRFLFMLKLALREGYDRHASARLLIDVGRENFICHFSARELDGGTSPPSRSFTK